MGGDPANLDFYHNEASVLDLGLGVWGGVRVATIFGVGVAGVCGRAGGTIEYLAFLGLYGVGVLGALWVRLTILAFLGLLEGVLWACFGMFRQVWALFCWFSCYYYLVSCLLLFFT